MQAENAPAGRPAPGIPRRSRRAVPVDPLVAPLGALAAIGTAALLTPIRETAFGNTNAALVLVVVIAATASLGGRGAGTIAALVSAMSYNFFLTRPYLSLHIDDATDVVTTILLVVVGLVVGEFAMNRVRRDLQLRRSTESSHRLERVAQLVASGASTEALCRSLADEVRDELGAAEVRWQPGSAPTGLPQLERSGFVPATIRHHQPDGFELPSGIELPVSYAGERLGAMVVTAKPGVGVSVDQRRVAVALADLLSTSLTRT